jgi:hypothetical protein
MGDIHMSYAAHNEASENYRWRRGDHIAHGVSVVAARYHRGFICRTFGFLPAGSLPWNRPRKRKVTL